MYIREKSRYKDGVHYRYFSIMESIRLSPTRTVQRQVLYLGEINNSQKAAWTRAIEVITGEAESRQVALFPDDREAPELPFESIQICVDAMELHRPRQWGACWLALTIWKYLGLDEFWKERLPASRQGTGWLDILKVQACYRLIDPGSEWRLYRRWYENCAMGDLLGLDPVIPKDRFYRVLDRLEPHRRDFFAFLKERWGTLFGARYEVLLYDLTSTYFESDAPFAGKRQFGYSRDKRSDCVQVVIALIVTPDGFPVAYEVMPGNTSDKTTLLDFVRKIEAQYGRSERVWVMDRGIPTEETLEAMRADPSGVRYLVGTPKGRLSKLEQSFLNRPWQSVRDSLQVKLHQQEGGEEVYILVRSEGRILKERSMRRRRLKKLWKRLHELQQQSNSRDQLQRKLGAAQQEAGRAWHLVEIEVAPEDGQQPGSFTFHLRREKLRQTMRREGRYLLRSNLTDTDPAELWKQYMQLSEVEQAFKELKHSLSIRPIYHQTEQRIEAHIFLSFIAYCLHVTLKNLAKRQASGLTPREILEKFASMQLVDVHLPTSDGRCLVMSRYTQPNQDHQLLLYQLGLTLPDQPRPRFQIGSL